MYYNRSQFTIDVFVLKYEHTGWNFFGIFMPSRQLLRTVTGTVAGVLNR